MFTRKRLCILLFIFLMECRLEKAIQRLLMSYGRKGLSPLSTLESLGESAKDLGKFDTITNEGIFLG